MSLIEERIPHAYVASTQVVQKNKMSTSYLEGVHAECSAGHGPFFWHGPVYVVAKHVEGAPDGFIQAALDGLQHDLSEHAKLVKEEPGWDNIIGGAWQPTRAGQGYVRSLGVPFDPWLVASAKAFGDAFVDVVREMFRW